MQSEIFFKEIVITQVSSASVSLIASTTIATFVVSSGGLITPYRRLIFCLSVSDMLQSSALIVGPWFSEFSYRSLYGIGNKYTCGIDAFLFLAGSSAWPLYTFCFCVYYLCKLRRRMSDNEFAQRVEKKMHAGIVVLSSAISILALSLGSVQSVGTMCYVKSNTYVILLVNSLGIPLFSLVGIIVCIFLIIHHVFKRENMYGGPRSSLRSRTRDHLSRQQSPSQPGSINSVHTEGSVIKRRFQTMTPTSLSSGHHTNENTVDRDRSSPAQQISSDVEGALDRAEKAGDEPTTPEIVNQSRGGDEVQKFVNSGALDVDCELEKEFSSNGYDAELQALDTAQTTEKLRNIVRSMHEIPRTSNHSTSGGNRRHSSNSRMRYSRSLQIDVINGDQQAIAKLYKRQLVSQACCYVMLFLVTIVPFLVVTLTQLSGSRPSSLMIRMNALFFPLGGLMHILIYTRPEVSCLRRKYPNCSRLHAFLIVLRAGGEVPDNIDAFSSCCGCNCFALLTPNDTDVGHPPLIIRYLWKNRQYLCPRTLMKGLMDHDLRLIYFQLKTGFLKLRKNPK